MLSGCAGRASLRFGVPSGGLVTDVVGPAQSQEISSMLAARELGLGAAPFDSVARDLAVPRLLLTSRSQE